MELQKAGDKNFLIPIRDKKIVYPEFKVELQTICYGIGIRTALDSHDLDSIFNFISRNFGGLTLKEVILAFDLYSGQKLFFTESHFNSFDLTFIGKVLKSYSVYKINQKSIKPMESEGTKQLTRPKMTKEENALQWYEWMESEVAKGKVPLMADFSAIFWHMEKHGIINLSDDEKEMFLDNVRQEIKDMILKLKAERKDYDIWSKKLIDYRKLKLECRKRIVLNHYENL